MTQDSEMQIKNLNRKYIVTPTGVLQNELIGRLPYDWLKSTMGKSKKGTFKLLPLDQTLFDRTSSSIQSWS